MMSRGESVLALLRHVRPIVLNSARAVEALVAPVGWTVGTRAVVEVLVEEGPLTAPALGARLDLPRQGVQRHVNLLLRLGHVRTRTNPRHRRSVLIELTDEGRDTFGRIRARELAVLGDLAPEIRAADLAAATRVLAALERDIRAQAAHRDDPEDAEDAT